MAKLDTVLDNSLREIQHELQLRVDKVKEQARLDYESKQPDLTSKIQRIEEIDQLIADLKDERDKLKTEIDNADPSVSTKEHLEAKNLYGDEALSNVYYNCKKSDIEIAKAVYKTTEVANLIAFKTIKRQIQNQFNIAITAKQKQQVIFNLQTSVDWKALGINMPNLFEVSNVEIKGGKIIIDNALPDLNK